MTGNILLRQKLAALKRLIWFNPSVSALLVVLSTSVAILEGIGLSFLLPIIDQGGSGSGSQGGAYREAFVTVFDAVGVPFELEYIILGVAIVMATRYSLSFLVEWLNIRLRTEYVRHLQTEAYTKSLAADIAFFDEKGSDHILNVIVTQARHARDALNLTVKIFSQGAMSLMYLVLAMLITWKLTLITVVFLGLLVGVVRYGFESGYAVGNRTAEANERVQIAAQAGTQGIRDVKLYGMAGEISREFRAAADEYVRSTVRLARNRAAMDNFYRLVAAMAVFVLIWYALTQTALSLGGIAVFLFAMYRLAPRASELNSLFYKIDGALPHVWRTQQFIDAVGARLESSGRGQPVPSTIDSIAFEDVSFGYEDEPVLDGVTFSFNRDEFVAFVGPSGAGKSTIVALLARLYEPDHGRIEANGTSISTFDIADWRQSLAIVRQDPFIFNETLRYNLSIGNRTVSEERLDDICEIAQVSEFLDELPRGYDTVLGEAGIRLSGGQRQRVAIARALAKDADLLILDEATSDLDTTLEQRVHEGIEAMDRDQGLLVIAHRLSTVRNADRIYTMSDGEITEVGPHEELVERDGTYAELYAKQSG